jgi:quinolinate synthase
LRISHFEGSTTQLLSYARNNPAREFIVATEAGILHQMVKQAPDKTFIPAPPDNSCACNDCPHMKRNTLEKVYLCMEYEQPELLMEEGLRVQAKKSLDRMLEISHRLGL